MFSNLVFLVLLGLVSLQATLTTAARSDGSKPNIIIIMTDDQDVMMNSLNYQPAVQEQFWQKGTFYSKHFCTMAQCCPSRVSMLTGKCGHNTNVTSILDPYGGYSKFVQEGWNDNYLPVWLQSQGYNTYYAGKLMNGLNITNYNKPFPNGWTGSDFLLDPQQYIYYNATMQRNQDPPMSYPGQYSTDLISDKSLAFLDDGAKAGKPLFLTVAPVGPHSETIFSKVPNSAPAFNPPVPANRHKDKFKGVKIPRTDNFNPDQVGGVSYLPKLAQWNESVVDYYDDFYRLRLEALLAIDDLVNAVFKKLEDLNLLDNTYVIYTSDNGYHIGQHRLAPGKTCAFEEDVRVPFFIRGPDIPQNVTVECPTSHTDVAPTIFKLAKISLHKDFDGAPVPIRGSGGRQIPSSDDRHQTEFINIEFWGGNYGEGKYPQPSTLQNNTYKALRIASPSFDLLYTVWCTNEKELYDMSADPGQMHNLHGTNSNSADYSRPALETRLDALLMVLKSCKGKDCMKPWEVLHPKGDVKHLRDAMDGGFDEFYSSQPKVSFTGCADGYLKELEGPQEVKPFGS